MGVSAAALDDPKFCEECHKAIVGEWRQSMHSRAHHERDPIYAAVRRIRIKKEGAAIAKACAGCHTPASAPEVDGKLAAHGVTCTTCHYTAKVDRSGGKLGVAALVRGAPGVMYGQDDPRSVPGGHGRQMAPAHFKDGTTLCLVCHDELGNKRKVPLCSTGPEWRQGGKDARTCVDCHMPLIDKPPGTEPKWRKEHRSHAFIGPHRAWLQGDSAILADAVTLTVELAPDRVVVQAHNRSAHGFPSGFPGRAAVLKVEGLAADGRVAWRNPSVPLGDPATATVLHKVYLSAAGKPTLAPYAARLALDSRLRTDERRTWTWPRPADITKVRVKLLLFLAKPRLAKKLKLSGKPIAKPKLVATTTTK